MAFNDYTPALSEDKTVTAADGARPADPPVRVLGPDGAAAPRAPIRPHSIASPHGERIDPYYWLRDDLREDSQVLAYLEAENAYTERQMASVMPLKETLYREMVARLKQDDESVPYFKNGYWYYSRFETGKEHPVFARRKESKSAPEELILDANERAAGCAYYQIGDLEISPDSSWLAFSEDTVGRRQYSLRFKNLTTGEVLGEAIGNVESDIAWANDNRTVLYVEKDPETLLATHVRKHRLGEDVTLDAIVFTQADKSFYTGVTKSKSERFIFIHMESTVSSEWRYAQADDPSLAFKVFLPSERDHEYQIEHLGDRFIIRTNWNARNFRLMQIAIGEAGDRSRWRELVAHRDDTFIHDFDVFERFIALSVRTGGLRKISIHPVPAAEGASAAEAAGAAGAAGAGGKEFFITSDEPAYSMSFAANPRINTDLIRYTYASLTTPTRVYDYDMRTGERTLLKQDPVLGDFDPCNYVTEFQFVSARDGQRIPVSLVYRKGFVRDGTAPLLQYAYGAYGLSTDPYFSSARLSLLDRGVVYAIAHVRGGQEMGRAWYDDGRLEHKKNSFNDFLDVTRALVAGGYAAASKVFAMGGSAGGLLVAAVANMSGEEYRGIIAEVPFVDVVTTMLDEGIPLTTNEYDEWGDPHRASDYAYMLSYSPYDNVRRQRYPSMLVTTGLWDSQVQYYEPAKWVAKLRSHKTDDNPLLLHVEMQAGHGGKSGRFERYRETALIFAFILAELGITA
ncbi:MAG TPA: S9 family peptidase [Steroidobacteraceae bacterium]|nr:S9 family peptidase [Steroidobacteraceae bacterium]